MNPATLFRIADNLTNGNLTDAKKQAKRVSFVNLQLGFFSALAWSKTKATAAAIYLKNPSQETWQQFCDAS
jgi:uncharacterized protein YjbI with pentapeptide repeats